MTTATTKAVRCPKCGTRYQIKSGTSGRLRCKKCQATFAVGGRPSGPPGRRPAREDKRDQQLAVKLMLVGGGVLILIAVIILSLGNQKAPGGGVKKTTHRTASRPKPRIAPRPENYTLPEHPRTIQQEFLTALANDDEETIRKLFLFDAYYSWARRKFQFDEDSPYRYDLASPEKKKELEDLAVEQMLADPQLQEYLKRYLVPALEDGTAEPVRAEQQADYGRWEYTVSDSKGKPLFNIAVQMRLKAGLGDDPWTNGRLKENWGVWKVDVKYHVSSLRSERPDKKAVDAILESKIRTERHKKRLARRKASRGPVEADPTHQDPLEGTGAGQIGLIRDAIAKLLDPETSGPEFHRARDALRDLGKPAIPFLLNALLNKDHKNGEDDILQSMPIITTLREITGESFGYGPPTADTDPMGMGGGSGLAGATPEARERAVRCWFGWWQQNKDTWAGRPKTTEEEEDGDGR